MQTGKKRALDLILTLDYELYGDGSGDVFETMIKPTHDFLNMCGKYNIKSTIFFEIMEYLQIDAEWNKGNRMNYSENPAKAIKDQIISAHNSGHDIQLHIHPHWINAKFENEKWCPDSRYWKLTKVPDQADKNFPLGLEELLGLGKESLEALLKSVDPMYQCNIFRAGGYCITPSEKIVRSLKNLGFIADSSVIPGAYLNNQYYYYDFEKLPIGSPYWWVDTSVDEPVSNPKNFLELPVFARKIKRYKKYDLQRVRIALKNRSANITKIKDKVEGNQSIVDKVKFFLEEECLTWDFCLFSEKKMNDYLKLAWKIAEETNHDFHPFILIGHSKEFLLPANLERFIRKNRELNYLTLKDAVSKINNFN
ncbi:MAG: hypothetical protein WD426_04830 [Anditalea sp.]